MAMAAVAGGIGGEEITEFTDVALGRQPARSFVVRPVGRHWLDFIWVGVVPLISESVMQALSSVEITGWAPFEVSVVDKSGAQRSGYHGLRIEGRVKRLSLDRARPK